MAPKISASFDPIAPWAVVALAAAAVVGLTLWAYRRRLQAATGRWRWVALGLRLTAVILCLLACLRPAVVVLQQLKQPASIVFLLDASTSMGISDEVNSGRRWDAALKSLSEARAAVKRAAPSLVVKAYRFDGALKDAPPDAGGPGDEPLGKATGVGTALEEATRREQGQRVAAMVLLSDGASNDGRNPLTVAQQLRAKEVPVVAVGYGSETAGASSRDLAVREVVAAPTVFVKNDLAVRGTLRARGYAGQWVDLELMADDQATPVATKRIKLPDGTDVVPVDGLTYRPSTPGDKLLTLRARSLEGELVTTNNQSSSYVTVLAGGLNVLYLQGPGITWEYKYLTRALDAAREIRAELKVIRRPAGQVQGELKDDELAAGKFNVYVLGDLPAAALTRAQQRQLAQLVEQGAGLMMLGGRSSFGDGGWADSPLVEVLPVAVRPGEGQIEPKGGLKVAPSVGSLDSYLLQIGPTTPESIRLWESLPPITGANRLGQPKPGAVVYAEGPGAAPLMVGQEVGRGRVLAFAGETWPWFRASEDSQAAHRRFWRQVVLWLAHKENSGEGRLDLRLDRRRIAVGQKLEVTALARDDKEAPLTDVQYQATVTPMAPGQATRVEPIELFTQQGAEARGSYLAAGAPGQYTVTVVATQAGKEVGRASSRFLVFEDDRELENPAANLGLLRQLAEQTGGEYLAPEELAAYLAKLDPEAFTRVETQVEYRLWDNWPFLLLFVAVLAAEWFLRKRKGLV